MFATQPSVHRLFGSEGFTLEILRNLGGWRGAGGDGGIIFIPIFTI